MAPKYFDTRLTEQNIRTIWDQINRLNTDVVSAQGTITAQQATIATLQAQLTAAQQLAQHAVITAGKATSATATSLATPSPPAPPPSDHDNQYAVVVAVIADLVAHAVDLSGPCGSWAVVNEVVKWLRPSQPTVGLIAKGGTNCNGYSIDALMYLDGAVYDLLIDAENAPPTGAAPQWSYAGQRPASDWRDPV